MRRNYLCALCCTLLLNGCVASGDISGSDDWQQTGYQDGIRGKTERTMDDFNTVDQTERSDYETGYNKGVDEYCNPNAAYQIGLSGQRYEGVCDGNPDGQKFRMEWQRGRQSYQF